MPKDNRGSESIAAAVAIPFFLFVMLAFVYIAEIYAVRAVVYEDLVETSERIAETAYLSEGADLTQVVGLAEAGLEFQKRLDDEEIIEKFVEGGISGISFLGSEILDQKGDVVLRVHYKVHADVPFLSLITQTYTETIRQHAYIGKMLDDKQEGNEDDVYVYVTDRGEVYHTSRSCTYILPRVSTESKETAEEENLRACQYCKKRGTGNLVYVTEYGECYHTSRNCSQFQRSVRRVRKSETSLPPCSKCSGGE